MNRIMEIGSVFYGRYVGVEGGGLGEFVILEG
jgi:hypothetical protein